MRSGRTTLSLHKYVLCRESKWFHDTLLKQQLDFVELYEDEESFRELCHLMYCEGVIEERYDDTLVAKMKERKLSPRQCLSVCTVAYNLGCQ